MKAQRDDMTIIEWFDPQNDMHLWAYQYLQKTGMWPADFIPAGIKFPMPWTYAVASKIADALIKERLGK